MPWSTFRGLFGEQAKIFGSVTIGFPSAAGNGPLEKRDNSMKILASLLACCSPLAAAETKYVGYFVEWGVYDRDYHVADIPAGKLTHINYAFAKFENGEIAVFDRFAALEKAYPPERQGGAYQQLRVLKKKHPQLKTLISVGGWTLSGPFSDVALTDASRAKFAKSCVAFIRQHGFDGVDVDWEYPVSGGKEGNKQRPEDKRNYTRLLAELRQQLDAAGAADKTRYLLTIAAPAGARNIANLELDKLHPLLDWFNLMAYDFHGSWDERTNFNAPLRAPANSPTSKELSVAAAVKTYLDAGVPPEKIVLGVPFFGRGWSGAKNIDHGLFQQRSGIPKGTWEEGVFDYKDLAANHLGKSTRYWNHDAQVPWLFNPATGLFISYDDPESITKKAAFARETKLGGLMIWELSADDKKGSLLNAARGE
jgi:chitinase